MILKLETWQLAWDDGSSLYFCKLGTDARCISGRHMVLGLGPRRTGRLRGRTRAEKEGAMIACVAGVAPSQGVGLVTMHDPWYPTPVHHDSQSAFSYLSSFLPPPHMAPSQLSPFQVSWHHAPSAGTHAPAPRPG